MPKLDRYLLGDFVQSFLGDVDRPAGGEHGGVLVDVLGEIADGGLPARLLLSQLGLQLLVYLPLILPLALMLGLMLSVVRLYRDSEMAVVQAIGVGPRRLLRPLLLIAVPVVLAVGACSLWLGPWAQRTGTRLIEQANRSLVVAGLEPGRFTPLPNNGGIVYIDGMSEDGTGLKGVFLYRDRNGRLDVVTAREGAMQFEGERERYLQLRDGHRIEGPVDGGLDFRLMRYAYNDLALPDRTETRDSDDPLLVPTVALFADRSAEAGAELHKRLAPPLLALGFALLALPPGPQFATPAALWPADAGLPRLPGLPQPDVHRQPDAGAGRPAQAARAVVADPAAAGWRSGCTCVMDGFRGRGGRPHDPAPAPARPLRRPGGAGHGPADLDGPAGLRCGDAVVRPVRRPGQGQLRRADRAGVRRLHRAAPGLYDLSLRGGDRLADGMGQLAATSELTALRALGLSRRRLGASAATALALLTALMVVNGETLAPWGQSQADQLKLSAKTNNVAIARYWGLWAREGGVFLNAVDGEERIVDGQRTLELRDVRLYRLGPDGGLQSLTRAAVAEHGADGWRLRDVRRITFGFSPGSATEQRLTEERWDSGLDPEVLAAGMTRARNLSAAELRASIDYRTRNNLDAREFEDIYWGRWFYPVNVLALCLWRRCPSRSAACAAAAWASACSWASCSRWASCCCRCSSAGWPVRSTSTTASPTHCRRC